MGGKVPVKILVVIAAILASGCSEATPVPEYSAQEHEARVMLGMASIEEMTQHVLQSDRQKEELTATCMNLQGFDYVAERPETTTGLFRDMSDRSTVEEYGFNISTVDFSAIEQTVESPNRALYSSLSPEEQQVWNDELSKCQAEAETTFNEQSGFAEINEIADQIYQRAEADPQVLDGWDVWARCMRDEGFDAPTEEALVADLRDEFRALPSDRVEAFKDREITTALTSFDCRQVHDRALDEAIQRALVELSVPWADAVRD